jgi:outer membrane lipoprotein SlyB
MTRIAGRYPHALVLLLLVAVAGCGARRPVLYPNEHYNAVGDAVAQRDIDECMTRAKAHAKSGGAEAEKAKEVARQTGFGAASGAAIGAVGGAVGGGGAGRGAAVGAATGATAGLIHGLFGGFFGPKAPDPLVANYVDRCLREKGYELVGWR